MWSTILGHLLHVFGSVTPGASSWSQWHSVPLLLTQGLLSRELAALQMKSLQPTKGRQSGFSRSLVNFCISGVNCSLTGHPSLEGGAWFYINTPSMYWVRMKARSLVFAPVYPGVWGTTGLGIDECKLVTIYLWQQKLKHVLSVSTYYQHINHQQKIKKEV